MLLVDEYPPAVTPVTVAYIAAITAGNFQRVMKKRWHCRVVKVTMKDGLGSSVVNLPNSKSPIKWYASW